jgi:hypothetical protein
MGDLRLAFFAQQLKASLLRYQRVDADGSSGSQAGVSATPRRTANAERDSF